MKSKRHIARLLRWMNNIRSELAVMHEEKHFQRADYKSFDAVDQDVESVIQEVERTELLKGK